jgi:hypothetical protein
MLQGILMAAIIIAARKDIAIGEATITGTILTDPISEEFTTEEENTMNGTGITKIMTIMAGIIINKVKPFAD